MRLLACAPIVSIALLLSAAVPAADARVADDPCAANGNGNSVQNLDDGRKRACYSLWEIPPHTTMIDENRIRPKGFGCPNGWWIPGTHNYQSSLILPGDWDFYAYRGEWVTLSLGSISDRPSYTSASSYTLPTYHNWGSWNWPVRTFTACENKVSALAAVDTDDHDDIVLPDAKGDRDATGAGDDIVFGGRGSDELSGGMGDDELLGGPGRDVLNGGPGSDELFDDEGRDELHGGPGDDRFSTRDGNHDVVDCGAGEDVAIGDRHDQFVDCEHVYRSAAEDPARPPVIG